MRMAPATGNGKKSLGNDTKVTDVRIYSYLPSYAQLWHKVACMGEVLGFIRGTRRKFNIF